MTFNLHGGVTRMVVLFGQWAIKLPTVMYGWKFFLYGFLANMQERDWAGFDDRLCPILYTAPGGLFVVMPRCQILTDDEFVEHVHDDWARMLDKETGFPLPYSADLPVELKTCSFGWLNGKIVAVDYGGCGRRAETTRTRPGHVKH